jgi:hypothetical protein
LISSFILTYLNPSLSYTPLLPRRAFRLTPTCTLIHVCKCTLHITISYGSESRTPGTSRVKDNVLRMPRCIFLHILSCLNTSSEFIKLVPLILVCAVYDWRRAIGCLRVEMNEEQSIIRLRAAGKGMHLSYTAKTPRLLNRDSPPYKYTGSAEHASGTNPCTVPLYTLLCRDIYACIQCRNLRL